MKHLRPEQVGRLIQAAETDRNRLLFSVIYEHGLRVSEALALTRGSLVRGYLQVKPRKKGRRSDERMNPATVELWNRVTQNLLPRTLIFPVSRQWVVVLFHRYATAAKIELQPRMAVHCLRHSLAHAMLDSGSPLPVVQRALRHRSIGSTGVYLQCDSADADRWRAKAITGQAAQPAAPASLAEIQAEIKRLSKLALSLQGDDAAQSAPVEAGTR